MSPDYSLKGLMLKLKLQYFGHLMWRTDSLEKILMLERLKVGGEGDDRGRDGWMASLTQWAWVWMNSGRLWRTGRPGVLHSMELQRVGHDWATELNCSLQCFSYLHSFFHVFNPLTPFFTLKVFANAHKSIGLRKTTFKIHALNRFLIVWTCTWNN